MVAKRGPFSLLECAAREAFWELPISTLRALGKEYITDFVANQSLFLTLMAMIMSITGMSEDAALDVLKMRLVSSHASTMAYLEVEGAERLVPDSEAQDMEEETKAQKERQAVMKEFGREFWTTHERLRKPDNMPTDRTSAGHPLHGTTYPVKIPDSVPDQKAAKTLLPPTCSVWKGNPTQSRSGSWNVHLTGWPRFSRSWVSAGSEQQALLECLQHVWTLWLRDHFLEPKDCPMVGIFK